jgi:hypothetical protein
MDEQERETRRDPSVPSPNGAGAEETGGSSETVASARKARVSVAERLQTVTGVLQALALALVALTAVFAAVPTLRHAVTNAFGSQPKTGLSLRPTASPAEPASGKSTPSTPSGCPDETGSYYVKPVTLLGSSAFSLKFCAVDVNDGQPIGLSYTLSGKVVGSLPSNVSLAIVSEPDPATCDLAGNPGNGDFYFQEEINPAANDGIWQLGQPPSYPGSQTIRHNVYFVVGSEAALRNLKSNPTATFPSNLIRLAYITVQGRIPPGHICRPAD